MSDKLAPAAFYNWGNAIGDRLSSMGYAIFSKSLHWAWHSDDLDAKIGPIWVEKEEAQQIADWKGVDRYIANQVFAAASGVRATDPLMMVPSRTGACSRRSLLRPEQT